MKNKTILSIILSTLWLSAQPVRAFDRVYTMGDKIDSSPLIVYANVQEAKELAAKKKKNSGPEEIVGDYLYRLKVLEVVKGSPKIKEVMVIQSPEFRADPRYFTLGQNVIAFLKPNSLSGKFLTRYGLPRMSYYECFANKQGMLAVADSSREFYLGSIKKYLSAKRAKRSKRAAEWVSLLENAPDELKENALLELSTRPYYPAMNIFIRCLGEENLTTLAHKNLKLFPPDSLEARLDSLMKFQKSDSRLVKVNLIKLVSPIHDDKVFKFLQRSLKDDKFEVRATAAQSLEGWTDKKAVKSLKKALDDDDDYVRSAAYEALTKQGFRIEKKDDLTYKILQEPGKKN
ncbi:MAG: HEAT repeat domain-containing protein [Candidatus Edwardsbacteria bacterium]|nr:HEAT repeat domain-containing protein [Candidatus Edwardsbacteria bacterium]